MRLTLIIAALVGLNVLLLLAVWWLDQREKYRARTKQEREFERRAAYCALLSLPDEDFAGQAEMGRPLSDASPWRERDAPHRQSAVTSPRVVSLGRDRTDARRAGA